MLVGRPHLVGEQPGPDHLAGIGDLGDDLVDRRLGDGGLVEVAQVAHQGHRAHGGNDGLPGLGVHAAWQPARQALPRETRLGQDGGAALAQQSPALVDRNSLERAGGSKHRERVGGRDGVVVMAAVQQPAEQGGLAVVDRGGVGELDDIGHAQLARQAVVAQRGPLVIEPADAVGYAALDRHRQVAAVGGDPVAEQLGRLVRSLQGAGHHRPAAGSADGHVLGGHDYRRGAHQHVLAKVLGQADLSGVDIGAGNEARVRHGDLVDEINEAGVADVGALVEGVLADHVGSGQEKEL